MQDDSGTTSLLTVVDLLIVAMMALETARLEASTSLNSAFEMDISKSRTGWICKTHIR